MADSSSAYSQQLFALKLAIGGMVPGYGDGGGTQSYGTDANVAPQGPTFVPGVGLTNSQGAPMSPADYAAMAQGGGGSNPMMQAMAAQQLQGAQPQPQQSNPGLLAALMGRGSSSGVNGTAAQGGGAGSMLSSALSNRWEEET